MRRESDFSRDWRFRIGDPTVAQEADARGTGAHDPAFGDAAFVEASFADASLGDGDWERVHLPHTWNASDTFTAEPGYCRGPGWYRKRFNLPEGWAREGVGVGAGAEGDGLSGGHSRGRVWIEFGAGFAVADVWVNGHAVGFPGGDASRMPAPQETSGKMPVPPEAGGTQAGGQAPAPQRTGETPAPQRTGETLAAQRTGETPVLRFMGGFTGFCVDVSDAVRERDNVIAVRVDNAHDPNILPGKQVPDFNLYGGLYREAKIVRLDPVHIARHGVAIATPRASDRSATARIEIAIRNEGTAAVDCACEVDIVDGVDGVDRRLMSLVSRGRVNPGGEHRFVLESPEIVDPILWSPDSPHLYRARVRVRKNLDSETSQAGVAEPQPTNTREARVVDEVSVPFGIRWFEFDLEKGFILNGKPLYLRGVNRHQDYPGLGNALPERMQARDAELIREMGGNFVRTSHYPQHPVFLDACDRLGILVYEEIATWQSIGKGDAFADNAERMLRDMIARDRNHPSIILWGLMNEHRSKPLFERLHAAAREADPTRLTIYAENRTDIGKEKGAIGITDVLGINYKLPHLDEIRAELPGIKFLSSEHTNFDTAARGNLEQELAMVEKLANDLDILEARPWISGGALWAMHDYGTDYEPSRPVQHAGVLDAWRIPKEAYYLLCSRWREEPTVHVCGHWTWHGREGETIRVLIVHNCDRVEVFLNDKACGAGGATSPTQFDVPYEPGILRAVGCRGTGENESRVETQIETAGPPVAIRLTAGTGVLRADGRDVAEIAAEIVDRAGRPVPTPAIEIAFEVEGPATLHGIGGIASAPVVDGVGRIALRASDRAGTIRVRAAHPGLEPGRAELRAVDCG